MRPGVEITSLAQAPPRSAPTDTGTAFLVGSTAKGVDMKVVRSLTEFETEFGKRGDTGGPWVANDYAETFFREGGNRLYVSRLNPGVGLLSVEEEADLAAMTREELDAYAAAAGVEDPASLANKDAVMAAIEESAEAQAAPAGLQAALDRLNKDLGPGQVFLADATGGADPASHDMLLAHAAATNRIALLEAPQGTAAALITFGTALQAKANGRYGGLFGPRANVPAYAGVARTVGWPAFVAGMLARNDLGLGPNVPAAGVNGKSAFAIDLTTLYTDLEYENLNVAGVDMARSVYGDIETYGWRSAVSPTGVDAGWLDLGNARVNMAIVAQADVIGERYVFSQIDGRGKRIAQFGAELRAMLVPFWESGQLYGETADEAFQVNVGSQVNTPESIAAGELHAVLEVRMSPFAELVVIEIVKVATTVAIAA